ncbi:substrate-binding domain-containing protein [Deinococcus radiomollis]|uniref:substrate-binding domain-containing protein n=1 Tax=Deinococcus radiomollis TaxID=468916 RepID=UPI003892B5A5
MGGTGLGKGLTAKLAGVVTKPGAGAFIKKFVPSGSLVTFNILKKGQVPEGTIIYGGRDLGEWLVSRNLTRTLNSSGTQEIVAVSSNVPLKKGLKITILPKNTKNPYNSTETGGGMVAAKEIQAVAQVVGPSDAAASSQVSYITSAISQHQNALVLAANDPNTLLPYLKQAMQAGVKVVTMDSDTAPEGRSVFVNQASSEGIGRAQVQLMAKLINYGGDIAILSATPTATNQNTWIKWMQDELKKPAYKAVHLVKIIYGKVVSQDSVEYVLRGCV